MRRRLTAKEQVDVIDRFTNNLERTKDIAKEYGISRQGVYKLLKRNGIDPAGYQRLDCTCQVCGKTFSRVRCQVRKQLNIFCSNDCYYAFLDAGRNGGKYIQNRHQQRIARQIISDVFNLQPGHIVHHEDRNCFNNNMLNLKVFACQGDHVRHHRGFDVEPVFDGATYKPKKKR